MLCEIINRAAVNCCHFKRYSFIIRLSLKTPVFLRSGDKHYLKTNSYVNVTGDFSRFYFEVGYVIKLEKWSKLRLVHHVPPG